MIDFALWKEKVRKELMLAHTEVQSYVDLLENHIQTAQTIKDHVLMVALGMGALGFVSGIVVALLSLK